MSLYRFLGEPGAEHLVVGVADSKAEEHPVDAHRVQALGAGEHELADPVQGIALPAPVAEHAVLH